MDRNEADLEFVDAPISVRYAETDKMGVVYHANYLVWFEVGRGAWCKSKGFRYAEMELNDKRYMMVAEASCRYKSPAHFEDEIVVRTAVTKSTDRIIRYCYEIRESKTWKLGDRRDRACRHRLQLQTRAPSRSLPRTFFDKEIKAPRILQRGHQPRCTVGTSNFDQPGEP
jgi:YbgC/YbaW family acyl-CoA thioester hydrolase